MSATSSERSVRSRHRVRKRLSSGSPTSLDRPACSFTRTRSSIAKLAIFISHLYIFHYCDSHYTAYINAVKRAASEALRKSDLLELRSSRRFRPSCLWNPNQPDHIYKIAHDPLSYTCL